MIAYFIVLNKKRILAYLAMAILILNLLYYLIFKISYLDWLYALKIRSKSVIAGNHQSSIGSILKVNIHLDSISRIILVILPYLIVAYITYRFQRNIKMNLLPFCLVFPSVITPFLHSYDVLFTLAGFLLVADFSGHIPQACRKILFFFGNSCWLDQRELNCWNCFVFDGRNKLTIGIFRNFLG